MKKFLFTLMILTLLIMCMSTTVFADQGDLHMKVSSDGIVTWDKVTDAKYYNLIVEYTKLGGPTAVHETEYTSESYNIKEVLDNTKRESGYYYITVHAVGSNDLLSDYCMYKYTSDFSNLDTPTNLRWDGKIARWDAVENATKYTVLLKAETGGGVITVNPSNPEYDFSSRVKDQFYFTVVAEADNYKDSIEATSPRYKAPTTTSVSEVQFENFTWLTNGQEYTQSNPKAILKSDFPGTITKQVIKINGKVMEADTFAGENIELAVYIKLNDGYTWNSSVNAWLDGKVADDFLKISSMGENERVFIWKHTTEYTDKIKITEQSPETLEYTNGEDVKLYVKATGASNYQWSMYEERGVGIKTVRGFYKIDGATSNEYIIKNADSSLDGKEYRCTPAVDDATIFTKTITLKLVEGGTTSSAEQNTQTEQPITQAEQSTAKEYKVTFTYVGDIGSKAGNITLKTDKGTASTSTLSTIMATEGSKVEIKAVTNDGYKFDKWEIVGLTSDKESESTNATYTFNITENTMFGAHFSKVETTEQPIQTEQPTTEEKTWTKASDWAEEELDKANKLDVIPELFKGQDLTQNITRKEFAHVAVKLYEKLTGNKATAVANNPFKDTDDVEVLKAYNIGITQGTGADTFTPDALITREQMATMMTRALTKAGIDTKVDLEKVTKFADDAEMHDWGKASIYYMSSIEIIKGVGNNTFNVLGNATREQALLISERSAEKFAK